MPDLDDLKAQLPKVRTRSERGRLGYEAMLRKYGKKQVDAWRRLGGRAPARTLAQIEAGIVLTRRGSDPKPGRRRRMTATTTRFA